LADYAIRKGIGLDEAKKALRPNLDDWSLSEAVIIWADRKFS
jgi:hypothetical protein